MCFITRNILCWAIRRKRWQKFGISCWNNYLWYTSKINSFPAPDPCKMSALYKWSNLNAIFKQIETLTHQSAHLFTDPLIHRSTHQLTHPFTDSLRNERTITIVSSLNVVQLYLFSFKTVNKNNITALSYYYCCCWVI